jgi:hypothetical protein
MSELTKGVSAFGRPEKVNLSHLLQSGAIVPVALTLALESGAGRADAEHAPVLLEEAKVGCVARFGVTY